MSRLFGDPGYIWPSTSSICNGSGKLSMISAFHALHILYDSPGGSGELLIQYLDPQSLKGTWPIVLGSALEVQVISTSAACGFFRVPCLNPPSFS